MTFFQFHFAKAVWGSDGGKVKLTVRTRGQQGDINAIFRLDRLQRVLPATSRFASVEEAKQFLVELFSAFAYDAAEDVVQVVNIERGEWDLFLVDDDAAMYRFMESSRAFKPGDAQLDSIFYENQLSNMSGFERKTEPCTTGTVTTDTVPTT